MFMFFLVTKKEMLMAIWMLNTNINGNGDSGCNQMGIQATVWTTVGIGWFTPFDYDHMM